MQYLYPRHASGTQCPKLFCGDAVLFAHVHGLTMPISYLNSVGVCMAWTCDVDITKEGSVSSVFQCVHVRAVEVVNELVRRGTYFQLVLEA